MTLYKKEDFSIDEYCGGVKEVTNIIEHMDRKIFLMPTPSTRHQRILSRVQLKLGIYLEGTKWEVFTAPYNIEIRDNTSKGSRIVIPDISVICDKSGFTDSKYIGVPGLIVEILSSSNQSHDLVDKLKLYMNYGVKEYWIINPMINSINVYTLNNKGLYEQLDSRTQTGVISSLILEGFTISLDDIFR